MNKKTKDNPLTRAEQITIIRAGQWSFPLIPHACEETAAALEDERDLPKTGEDCQEPPVSVPRSARRRRVRRLPLFDRAGIELPADSRRRVTPRDVCPGTEPLASAE